MRHFLEHYCIHYRKRVALDPLVEEIMTAYRWPGNVREMENLIQSLVITCERNIVGLTDLPASMIEEREHKVLAASSMHRSDIHAGRPLKDIVADMERQVIRAALAEHGSVGKVARLLGVNRTTIFRKLHPRTDGAEPQAQAENG